LGWYSDSTKDILANWPQDKTWDKSLADNAFDALLKQLNWTMIGGAGTQPTSSLYQAAVFSVQWDRKGAAPAGDPLQDLRDHGDTLNVAIGNTTIDAFTALIAARTDQHKADLLRAFQYDFLPLLNQTNGEALLEERIRQEWFGTKPGGYSWTIVPKDSDGSAAPILADTEMQWLA